MKSATEFIGRLSPATRLLLCLWLLFLLLVACGIHGSSIGWSAQYWTPGQPYSGYLFGIPKSFEKNMSPDEVERARELLMAKSRWIRGDEIMVATPYALSQLSHNPPFPVVNTNIGTGQNMLIPVQEEFPVLHVTALARPATWGYFFLGPQRGLAWYWWFQVFSCFTCLYLLLVVILRGHKGLAAFGAFWFCASAYIVGWSVWPTHVTFFAALVCVSLYYLLASEKRSTQVICAILSGLGTAGFFMILYPPWQVSLGYLFFFLFLGLFIRDRLYLSFKSISRHRLLCITGACLLAAGLIASFVIACLPAFRIMAGTVYPGNRVSLGGDYTFALLFKGMYNLITLYDAPPAFLANESEAASFYHLFPAVILGILLSKQLLVKMGVFGWLLLFNLLVMLYFMLVGFPERLAKLTLLRYAVPHRMDLAVGAASIILCIYVLALISEKAGTATGWWDKLRPVVVGLIITVFFILHGLATVRASGTEGPTVQWILISSLVAGFVSFSLISGRKEIFCGVMGVVVVATGALFNPLSTNLSHIYRSELAQQVIRLNKQSPTRPLWLCYGNIQPDILINALGGRALAGTHWPPQLSLWEKFDSQGVNKNAYNGLAQIALVYDGEASQVTFKSPGEDGVPVLLVRISPNNPILKSLGARYVLAFDDHQQNLAPAALNPIYKSPTGKFSIFEIPQR